MLTRRVIVPAALALAAAAPGASAKPVAALSGPATVTAGQKATFDASSSKHDAGRQLVEYAWDLDENGSYEEVRSGARITIVPTTPGSHRIAVRVTDDAGASSVATGSYLVVEPTGPAGDPSGSDGSGATPGQPDAGAGGAGPLGGDPELGVAPLDPAARRWLTPRRFAAISGATLRRLASVRRGLWVNLMADRPARFSLRVHVRRAAARRLGLRGPRKGRLVRIARTRHSLPVAGQTPFRVVLPRSARRKLTRPVRLIVRGVAVDDEGNRSAVARTFITRR